MKEKQTKYLLQFKKLFTTQKFFNGFKESELDLLEEILKQYAKKVPKKTNPQITRKDIADRVFSDEIRLCYSDDKGMCECVTCWVKLHWTRMQNGHYKSRGRLRYRFSYINCHPQCYACNIAQGGNYRNYTKFMISRYGEKTENDIWNDQRTLALKPYDYIKIIVGSYNEVKKQRERIGKNIEL